MARRLIKPIKTKMNGFLKTPKYADGITYAGTSKQQMSKVEKKVSELLKKFELTVSINKTERIVIPNMGTLMSHKNGKQHWSNLDWLLHKETLKDNSC